MKKILIKISGEYLGSTDEVFNFANIKKIALILKKLQESDDYALYITVGGGNICRGRELSEFNFKNGAADHIGMLSTVQNAIILKETLDKMKTPAHVMAPFAAEMLQIHPYQAGRAKWWAEDMKSIVIFGGGLGLCGFSTDMTSVSRAYEVGVDFVIKVTEVGGLFTADPKKDSNAQLIPHITSKEVLSKGYSVMDEEAFAFAKNKDIKIKIIDLENLYSRDFNQTDFGTLITN